MRARATRVWTTTATRMKTWLMLRAGRARSTRAAAAAVATASSALHPCSVHDSLPRGGPAAASTARSSVVVGHHHGTVAARRPMSFGGGAGFKGMEGFFKQEKLKAKVEEALNAKAKAEEYLAKKKNDGRADGEDGMPPPPWVAPPPPMGVQAMVWGGEEVMAHG